MKLAALLIVAACSNGSEERTDRSKTATVDDIVAPKNQRPRHEVMADTVVAALATGDYANVDALLSKVARQEMGTTTRDNVRKLLAALEDKNIDLKKARIERVERLGLDRIENIDVYLVQDTTRFKIKFTVLGVHGYELMTIDDKID